MGSTARFSPDSPPARRRGLKPLVGGGWFDLDELASRAEAWIETALVATRANTAGLASRAEAWIETRE